MKRVASGAFAAIAMLGAACGSGATGPHVAGTVPARPTTTALAPAGADTTSVALFFTRNQAVEQVMRQVPKVARIGAVAMQALLAGPNDADRQAGLGTAIPAGTALNGLTITDGIARVDLTRSFEAGGSGAALRLRLAKVTCTLDAFPTVTGVRFAFDGQLSAVLSGDGAVVDQPVTCNMYR
jgi:spore germination protein GerM